jgi:radical SAM protein with 4Fe4S-binding SPASM domain
MSPLTLDINPTDYCNLSCKSCWKRNERFEKLDSKIYQLSDERLCSLVNEAVKLGIKKFEITGGGEPLLRPITSDLMKIIKQNKRFGSITTNGTLFNQNLIKEFVILKWDRIVFSIDGPDKKTNDCLRGKSFDKIVETINLFNKYKKEFKTEKPGLFINAVISNKNYTKLEEYIYFAKKLKIDFIKFETLTIHSDFGRKLQLNDEQKKQLVDSSKRAHKLSKKLGIETNLNLFFDIDNIKNPNNMIELIKKNKIICKEPFQHIVVKTDGSVGPCCLFYGRALNIKDYSLQEIWNSRYFNDIRKKMKSGKLMDYCRICNIGQISQNQNAARN